VPAIWPVGVSLAGCFLICMYLLFSILCLNKPDAPIGYDCVLVAAFS